MTLEAVPTSGFRWELVSDPGPAARLVGDDFEVTNERVGGPALQRFRFEAVEPGELELRFALRRPWESRPPVEERTVGVEIAS